MLNFERLTVKAGEAIQGASEEARRRGNAEIAGVHLFHALLAMANWGDRWESEGTPPVTVTHRSCGHQVMAVPACSHCGGEMTLSNITADPLPTVATGTG